MKRIFSISDRYKRNVLIIGVVVFLFFMFLETFSASASTIQSTVVPGLPISAKAVLLGGGVLGIFIRFARKRFHDFKRGMDILLSLTGLVVAAPIILITGILVKLTSRGPIFFRQERVGRKGRLFYMYKFRTMQVGAEETTGPVWAKENDSRVTLVGKFLRKSRIDEIPQFLNVLRGEMSMVGPRPERPVFVTHLSTQIKDYNKRLRVKPGITGLAQVLHKYDETIEDVKKKIKLDLLYIREMCLTTDLRILIRTILVVLTCKGAR